MGINKTRVWVEYRGEKILVHYYYDSAIPGHVHWIYLFKMQFYRGSNQIFVFALNTEQLSRSNNANTKPNCVFNQNKWILLIKYIGSDLDKCSKSISTASSE